MLVSAPFALLVGAALGAAVPPVEDGGGGREDRGAADVRTVLLIAGADDDHPRGTPEYEATVKALAGDLERSNVGERLRIETAVGWPKDPATLTRADVIVLLPIGGESGNSPVSLAGARWKQLEAAAARGCGVVAPTTALHLPEALHDEALRVLGGRFDFRDFALGHRNKGTQKAPAVTLATPKHPTLAGVEPWALHGVGHWSARHARPDAGYTSLLTVPSGFGTAAKRAPQTVAWALERAVTDCGPLHRAIGFTTGPLKKTLFDADARRFLLNAIVWSAGVEIPLGGVRTFDELWTPVSREGAKLGYETEREPDWFDDRVRDTDPGPFFFSSVTLPDGGKVVKGVAITLPHADPAEHVLIDTLTGVARCGWGGQFLAHSDRRFGLIELPQVGGKCVWSLPESARWRVRGAAGGAAGGQPAAVRYEALGVDGANVTLHFSIADVPVRFVADADGARYTAGPAGATLLPPAGGPGLVVMQTPLADAPADPAPRWGAPLVTAGTLGEPIAEAAGAFAVDTVELPFDNPPHALLFLSGIGFAPDGTAYVAAAHGDVWQVKGLGGDLSQTEWRRFATGFYQPLGLTVRILPGGEPEVFALGRDRITRLIDVNGDGEADRYESFNADLDIAGQPHAYAMGLETDEAGNFYFLKSGSASTRQGGCLVEVSADGSEMNVVATGFRHPNGLGLSPPGSPHAGLVTAADNEGNWVPATPLHLIDPALAVSDAAAASYYAGFVPTAHRESTLAFDPPALWMPRAVCTSAGGQCWLPRNDLVDDSEEGWGDLAGAMLHLSYGRCTANLVLTEELHVSGAPRAQGATMPLPGVQFEAGVCRGRFFPGTADLWVCGLDGWQTAAVKDGCLQRLRRTDAPLRLPTAVKAHRDGLELRFATALSETAADPSVWQIEAWTYRRAADYGSPELRPSDPTAEGHDVWPVERVTLSEDRTAVFLTVPRLEPVMQYSVHADLTAAPAADARAADAGGDVLVPVRLYGTIHHAGDRWTGWADESGEEG